MSTTVIALQVEKGIPLPVPRFRGANAFSVAIEAALNQMQAGDSFAYDDSTPSQNQRATVRHIAKRLGIKVTVRKLGEKKFRVWRLE